MLDHYNLVFFVVSNLRKQFKKKIFVEPANKFSFLEKSLPLGFYRSIEIGHGILFSSLGGELCNVLDYTSFSP